MVKISIEDILFWIFILIAIGTALWLLHGSPPESSAIITIALTFAGSELLIWKTLFNIDKRTNIKLSQIDKKTTISFMKIKNDMDKNNLIMNNKLDNRFNKLEEKLNLITSEMKGGKK